MKIAKLWIALLFLAAGAFAVESALAAGHGGGRGGGHFHGGARVGVYFGAPLFWPSYYYGYPYAYGYPYGYPYYYGSPYYYPSASVVTPPAYVEQRQSPAQPQGIWYYCASARAYYPYVKQCPESWQQVPAQPPS